MGLEAALFGFLGVAITALVSWMIARRGKSGSVRTSEAETLWQESNTMREELRAEVTSLRTRIGELQTENREEATALRKQLREAQKQADALRREVRELRLVCGVTNDDVGAIRREMQAARGSFESEHRAAARQGAVKKATATKKAAPSSPRGKRTR